MDFRSDIKRIQFEAGKVTDRHIVEAIKHVLQHRRSQIKGEMNLDSALEESIKDMHEGRVIPHEEVRKKYDKWL